MSEKLGERSFDELERRHKQAKEGLTWALRNNDEEMYREMDSLETKVRREKIRRMVERGGP